MDVVIDEGQNFTLKGCCGEMSGMLISGEILLRSVKVRSEDVQKSYLPAFTVGDGPPMMYCPFCGEMNGTIREGEEG